MTNMSKIAVIDDVVSSGIDSELQENLLDLFVHAMKAISATLAREAKFDTSDFATANQRGCEAFQLQLCRLSTDDRAVWRGEITKGDQHLTVIGHLE